ncbi:MAG TPA: BMP family ABC transporter substrate-binding protein, partial [Spirochaetota bacterium]
GVVEIPLKKIIGTFSHSRSNLFAANFMPLAPYESEFGSKWSSLYVSHINEGIRDPIKVCEYLNWYYVIEGNKRVSVLKYMNAVSISGEVRRLIPKMDKNDRAVRAYYEFLRFNKKTGIFNIWFSDEDGFSQLLSLLEEYEPNVVFEQNKYIYFLNHVYNPFREIYHKVGGEDLAITTGDAILAYLNIYGVPTRIVPGDHDRIKTFLSELKSIDRKELVNVSTEPIGESRKNLFSTITTFAFPKRKQKIAFAYAMDRESSGWTYAHELGRQHIQHLLDHDIETSFVENVPETTQAYEYFKKLAEEGNDIIFATRPTFIKPTLKAALEYPDVKFLVCTATHSYKNVITYAGRIYEPRFLLGVIAGALTKTNVIGYMGEYPISEVIASANAFTLGARMVNPEVKVKIAWSYKWDKDGRTRNRMVELQEMGVDFISHDSLPIPGKVKKYGLYAHSMGMNGGKDVHFAMPIWHWGVFYEKLVRSVLSGSWKAVTDTLEGDTNLLHFWWGLDSGVVDIFYSLTHLPHETQRLIDFMRKMIIENEFDPFAGPIYDNKGNLQIPSDSTATHDQIIYMDWFVQGIEGEVPSLDKGERSDDPLTDLLGVRK